MGNVYFLDIFMFVYILQFLFYFKESMLSVLVGKFLQSLVVVFSYTGELPLSFVVSVFTFLVLLTCCFGGYFMYSFCPCGMIEFTFVYAMVAWLSTFLTFISGEKFSVYITKVGDGFLKTFSMLLVEVVSEISRPLALTVRLTVNVLVGHVISMMLFQLLELYLGIIYVWIVVFAIMMECFVFFIQSYIFSRLIYLYLNE
uniref:F-ATPase protein 6 n=1 Tax=Baylisascaris schroederi TaxID=522413 RepID=G0YF46_BAYSC|nr:ATP synthase F0 subunit 6 [Baylisascaris schroederi]ADU78517.1 ATP synthase F0 subunit 6 [Baylisascaris schroederi]AJF11547.1 ATP synthase F0 subunit 6 [Baylisascaris schroederi]AJF11548.1 ATP synthase F0 subunit 6 [Baylisascaris schroederi]AJF11552.1 ATP synthase F0 subunit 6 [Baylisascaris schroederi]AJF11555.1 ATP synthase F0 subunit 6 [Baylisascaris schroederi]